jgi:hypothetical protein
MYRRHDGLDEIAMLKYPSVGWWGLKNYLWQPKYTGFFILRFRLDWVETSAPGTQVLIVRFNTYRWIFNEFVI